jgi:2'-5' RNA ligase
MSAERKEKYFIAIVPPEPIKTELQQLKQNFYNLYNTKGALRSPAHITLHMPFEFKEKEEEKINSFLTLFCSKYSPFDISIKNYNCFEPRVIFADVTKNESLFYLRNNLIHEIRPSLQILNADYKGLGFHPHITLAFRDLKKTAFYEAWNKYKDEKIEFSFKCSKITLLKHQENYWKEHREFLLVAKV